MNINQLVRRLFDLTLPIIVAAPASEKPEILSTFWQLIYSRFTATEQRLVTQLNQDPYDTSLRFQYNYALERILNADPEFKSALENFVQLAQEIEQLDGAVYPPIPFPTDARLMQSNVGEGEKSKIRYIFTGLFGQTSKG